ncbi:MAG: hypothetical protein Q8N69_00545 [bacterium]|nr:hypothetical protein [bacterium]
MRKDSFSSKLLFAIGDVSKDLLVVGGKMIFDPHELMRGTSLYRDSRFKNGMCGLERYGFIGKKKIDGKKVFYLTEKGKNAIIKKILLNKGRGKDWDGKWRSIIFDIPELSRKDRDFLRRELQFIGFEELQKSVWVFPYDFERELNTLLKSWKVEFKGDIRFLTIEKMNDDDLKERFNLD